MKPSESSLEKLTAEFIETLKRFAQGSGQLTEATEAKNQLFQHLRLLPGAFMLTDRGNDIFARVQSAWKEDGDSGTAPELARNLVKMLEAGGKVIDEVLFIDDTTTIFLDGEAIEVSDPLAYAILKVLYRYRPDYVKRKQLLTGLSEDRDMFARDLDERLPILDGSDDAIKKQIIRAIQSLPPKLRALVDGERKGRRFRRN